MAMKRMRWVLGMTALVMALALAACGGGTPTPTPTSSGGGQQPTPTPTEAPDFDAEEYFRGKTINIIVGYAAGGGTDLQARFLSTAWSKFIPGNPRIQVQNLTPALAAANRVWNSEPDGLTLLYNAISMIQQSKEPSAVYRASEFQIIGAPVQRNAVWMIRGELPYQSIEDAMGADGPVLRAAGAAAQPALMTGVADIGLMLVSHWLDIPFEYRVVADTGTDQELLMIERGDTNNFAAGSVWYQLPNRRPGWVSDGFIRPFALLGAEGAVIRGNAEMDDPNVPNVYDLFTDEQKELWDALMAPEIFVGKNLMAPPGTPPEVVEALRTAYEDAIADPEFRAEFERLLGQPIEIEASGAEVQEWFRRVEEAFFAKGDELAQWQEEMYNKYIRN